MHRQIDEIKIVMSSGEAEWSALALRNLLEDQLTIQDLHEKEIQVLNDLLATLESSPDNE